MLQPGVSSALPAKTMDSASGDHHYSRVRVESLSRATPRRIAGRQQTPHPRLLALQEAPAGPQGWEGGLVQWDVVCSVEMVSSSCYGAGGTQLGPRSPHAGDSEKPLMGPCLVLQSIFNRFERPCHLPNGRGQCLRFRYCFLLIRRLSSVTGPKSADWPPSTQAWAIPQILIKGIDETEELTGPMEVGIDQAGGARAHSGRGGTHSGLSKSR
ncbi:hypothetical protein AOLI_G00050710 [Acnodon oligacanthus]